MPSRRASMGALKWIGLPSSRIWPSSGTVAPDRHLISEDLPAPLSPITARISPARLTMPWACITRGALLAVMSAASLARKLIHRDGHDHQDAGDQHLVDRR